MENICNVQSRLWNADTITDAKGLLLAITTTDFLCALVTNACLKYVQGLTTNLQAEARDIVSAVREIETVTATIQDVRDNVDTHHTKWFLTVNSMCSSVGNIPSLPRRCGKQTHRCNTLAYTPSEYYRRTISIPLLDHLISEMKTRFGKHQQTALLGLSIVPSVLVSIPPEDLSSKVQQLVELCENDLPSPECIDSELHTWQLKWQRIERTLRSQVQHSPSDKPVLISLLFSKFFVRYLLHLALLRDPSVS